MHDNKNNFDSITTAPKEIEEIITKFKLNDFDNWLKKNKALNVNELKNKFSADFPPGKNSISDTDYIFKLKPLLLGTWVNKKFIDGLGDPNEITDPKLLLAPIRSFSFSLKQDNKIKIYFELDYESTYEDKAGIIAAKKITPNIYSLASSSKEGKMYMIGNWYLNVSDTSIIIIEKDKNQKELQYKYVKVGQFPLCCINPIPSIMNTRMLNGKYTIKDKEDNIISKNVIIDTFKVENFLAYNSAQFYDYFFYKDANGKVYPSLSFEGRKKGDVKNGNNIFWDHFVYLKEGTEIKLFEFRFRHPNESNQTDINSLVLKYRLLKQ